MNNTDDSTENKLIHKLKKGSMKAFDTIYN